MQIKSIVCKQLHVCCTHSVHILHTYWSSPICKHLHANCTHTLTCIHLRLNCMHASGPIAFMLFAYIVLLKVSILHACIRMHFFIRIKKLECANHAVKCYHTALKNLVNNNLNYKGKGKLTEAMWTKLTKAGRSAIIILMRSKESDKQHAVLNCNMIY